MEILKTLLEDVYFLSLFLVGIIFWITGRIVNDYPPKKINHLYGYRTKRSMKSQEAWDFAQRHSVQLMIKSGIFMIGASFLGPILKLNSGWGIVLSMSVIFGIVGYLFYQTETALKEKFGK